MAEKDGKKRSRQSNGVAAPNKKTKVDSGPSGTARVIFADEGLAPVVASAPGVKLPNISFKAFAKVTTGRATDAPKPSTHNVLLHSTKHPRLDYTATPATTDSGLVHYVAIFDPKTQQLQVTPAHHVSLRSTLRSEAQEAQKNSGRRTMAQQREALGQEFGTKKAKKAIASKTENAITKGASSGGKADDAENAVLSSVAEKTTDTKSQAELTEDALAAKPIPKPNTAAEKIEDIYPISVLIPQTDMRLLQVKDWQDKARADEPILFNNRFTAGRVVAIAKADDQLSRLKALRYLNLLLDFNAALGTAGRAGKKVPKKDILQKKLADYPEPLIDSVRRRFSDNNELNKYQQDYLYTHMCAISLYVDFWSTDISNLKDDLKLENKQVGQYFLELGCRVGPPTEKEREGKKLSKAQAAATRVAKLKLPLEFPRARMVRRR